MCISHIGHESREHRTPKTRRTEIARGMNWVLNGHPIVWVGGVVDLKKVTREWREDTSFPPPSRTSKRLTTSPYREKISGCQRLRTYFVILDICVYLFTCGCNTPFSLITRVNLPIGQLSRIVEYTLVSVIEPFHISLWIPLVMR